MNRRVGEHDTANASHNDSSVPARHVPLTTSGMRDWTTTGPAERASLRTMTRTTRLGRGALEVLAALSARGDAFQPAKGALTTTVLHSPNDETTVTFQGDAAKLALLTELALTMGLRVATTNAGRTPR